MNEECQGNIANTMLAEVPVRIQRSRQDTDSKTQDVGPCQQHQSHCRQHAGTPYSHGI